MRRTANRSAVRPWPASTASSTRGWPTARRSRRSPRSGAFLVPTLVVTDVNRTLPGLTPVQRERQDLIERRHRASTEAAIELGIPLATGTDTGEVGVTADMVAREIALLREHGASPMAAIRAATSAGARLLGLDARSVCRGGLPRRPRPRQRRPAAPTSAAWRTPSPSSRLDGRLSERHRRQRRR